MSKRREVNSVSREDLNENLRGEERTVERIPLSKNKDVLTLPKIPGMVCRWMNDDPVKPHRIADALRAGYRFIDTGEKVGQMHVSSAKRTDSTISKDVGNSTIAYGMMITEEWYNEDQTAKARKIQDRANGIKNSVRAEGFYGSFVNQKK